MKLRRLLCFLLALSLFICGAYSALPCGHVAAAEIGQLEYNGVLLPSLPVRDNVYYAIIHRGENIYDVFYSQSNAFLYNSSNKTLNLQYGIYYRLTNNEWKYSGTYSTPGMTFGSNTFIWASTDIYDQKGGLYYSYVDPVDPNAPSCFNIDANCDNICDECGELLPMEYWSTALEYLITAGYGIIEQSPLDYFCVLYNKKDLAPELIVGETKFEINTSGDVLLTKNPQLYKLFAWEDGSFSHYNYDDVSHTSDGLYLDPNQYVIDNSLQVLYSNHSINNRFVYNPDYDPFGGGSTVGGGADREQATRFDIDVDTYDPIGGLPADPEYGSGRVDVVVSPSAPPVSVPISPTSPVPTPDPSDPVVTPSPDPSDPNSIIIQNQITNIGNELSALPDKVGEKIGDKIGDSIKGLFVPSETDIVAVKEKWTMLLDERFGAVYESTTVLDSVFDAFVFDAVQPTFTFPTLELEFSGVPFVLGGWEVRLIPEGFDFIVPIIKTITNISLTLVFINAMRKKYEKVVVH